jgi:hypothetical protein
MMSMPSKVSDAEELCSDVCMLLQSTSVLVHLKMSLPGGSLPSYVAAARTPPASYPSNLTSGTSRSLSPSTATDTLFCTINLTRVNEEDTGRKDPGKIRDAIEKEVRMKEGQGTWRCLVL